MSTDDLMSLVRSTTSPPMQVGAVLLLDLHSGLEPAALSAALEARLPRVPRMRQKLLRPRMGGGRPVWVDDPDFRIENHLSVLPPKEAPRNLCDVLEQAAALVLQPLPEDRPLWAAQLVTDLGQDRAALIVVFHHVVADGLGLLAVLGALVDGPSPVADNRPVRTPPSDRQLALDAALERCRSLMHWPATVARFTRAVAELGPTATGRAESSSLNQPTGAQRRLLTVSAELETIHATAHRYGATVNDVMLAAVSHALHRLLAERGEHLSDFVISVPFSSRMTAGPRQLGNQSGVIPLLIPAAGPFSQRLTAISAITSRARRSQRGASTAALAPAFRLLATIGLYQRFIDRQHVIHTFVSNLRGPPTPLSLLGCPISAIVPLSFGIGNVTVSFTVLSYAGNLTVTVNADPVTCPDLGRLCSLLDQELNPAAAGGDPPKTRPIASPDEKQLDSRALFGVSDDHSASALSTHSDRASEGGRGDE